MAILQSYSTYVVDGSKWRVCKVNDHKWVLYRWLRGDREWCNFGTYRTRKAALLEIAGVSK